MIFNKKRPICAGRGYTLIELLVVIAIIGILVSIVTAYLSSAKARGRDAQRIADVKQLDQAIEVYFSSCNAYPTTLPSLTSDCNGNPILNSVPIGPDGVAYPYYSVTTPTLQYHVCATLELVTTSGLDKSGHAPINLLGDRCNGTLGNVYDKYGP